MVAADRRAGRPVCERTGLDRCKAWRLPRARTAGGVAGARCPRRAGSSRPSARTPACRRVSTRRRSPPPSGPEHAARARGHAHGRPCAPTAARAWRSGSTARCRRAARWPSDARWPASSRTGRDLAGREPVNEVRAHRLVATLRRLGRLKEIRRSDPHTSTDLPEQHPHSVERLSDSTARPTPLTVSDTHESARFRLLAGHRRQRAVINDSA